ncbi:MAG: ComF family protein [Chlamydiales bacterium]|nr:ComF family protein [Chlamydiales bacterium]
MLTQILDSFLSVIYPKFCAACLKNFNDPSLHLCQACQKNLTFLNTKEYCTTCFSIKELPICPVCKITPSYFTALAAVFDYEGPAGFLIKKFKYEGVFRLAASFGSFMTLQFLNLNWPLPDIIVPVPQPFNRYLERGYNHSFLLAKMLSKQIHVPCKELLRKSMKDLPQAALNLEQRKNNAHQSIKLKKHGSVEDKIVLLIDDVMTTRTTLNASANALLGSNPKELYGLTLCKTNL